MQDRQDCAVGDRVHELVAVPGRCERAGLGLAVADDAGRDQVGVIRHRAEGVGEGRARRFGRDMARDAAGEGEALEELLHTLLIARDVGVDLRIAAVQPVLRDHGVAAVTGAGKVDHIEVIALNDAV